MSINPRPFLIAIGLGLIVGVLFGVVPAAIVVGIWLLVVALI